CASLLGLSAPAWSAGLDLTWNACNEDGGSGDLAATCSAANTYVLVACFQPPADMNGFQGLDAWLDLQVEGTPALPAVWHFETSGCDASGLSISSDRSAVGGACTATSPWDATSVATITSYGAGFGGATRARMLCSVAFATGST